MTTVSVLDVQPECTERANGRPNVFIRGCPVHRLRGGDGGCRKKGSSPGPGCRQADSTCHLEQEEARQDMPGQVENVESESVEPEQFVLQAVNQRLERQCARNAG